MITLKTNADEQITFLLSELADLDPKAVIGTEIVRTVAFGQLAEMRRRIRVEGLATNGGKIGNYSTRPGYFAQGEVGSSFGRPLGKFYKGKRRSKFAGGKKKGQDHKTRYFEKGYGQFKTAIGRNTLGSVNLSLSGNMLDQMNVFNTGIGWGIGWTSDELADRAIGFEKKYKKSIFGMSQRERKLAVGTIKRMLGNAFNR